MKRSLLAFLALLPLLAPAAGTATVRVTNAGAVPIIGAGQEIDLPVMVSLATTPVPIYLWILVVLGGAVIVLSVLVAGFRSKRDRCPHCGMPLVNGLCMNDECPEGLPLPPLPEPVSGVVSSPPPLADPDETCPNCGSKLVDGMCPNGVPYSYRCLQCGAILVNGKCPNGCVEPEICPFCHSELVDGCCPNNCTVFRCTDCGSILVDGFVCPKGCEPKPLNLFWPGPDKSELSPFALEVVAPSEHAGFRCDLPAHTIVGRSCHDAREPFVVLLLSNPREKRLCSRRYVRLDCEKEKDSVLVTLLNPSHNPAWVEGKRISLEGETGELREGGLLKLNPGYELKLVRRDTEESAR